MSRLEQVENEVKSLNPDELQAFREWFADFDDAIWDQQIENDAKNGKLLSMAERALRDHENGRSTKL